MNGFFRPALFLDRDGVVNIDHAYVHRPEDFQFINGIFELVSVANNAGYLVIVVTNQAGIGRGYYTEADFHALTDWMHNQFALHSARIDAVFFCPFHPEHGIGHYKKDADCRKPKPGMILEAASRYNIDLDSSILIGDKSSDIEAGIAAAVGKNILFNPDRDSSGVPFTISTLLEATQFLTETT